jgi:hypothetical protein
MTIEEPITAGLKKKKKNFFDGREWEQHAPKACTRHQTTLSLVPVVSPAEKSKKCVYDYACNVFAPSVFFSYSAFYLFL